jgi:hypothetical protein
MVYTRGGEHRWRDLPVSVELGGALGDEVAAYVESEAGWQVVAPDGPPPPVFTIAAAPSGEKACVVVYDGTPALEQVRAALLAGALDIVAWPADRGRLLEAPRRVRATRRTAGGGSVLRVAASAGGAGGSTVALAIGGLLAWSGRQCVVVGGDDLLRLCGHAPWRGPGAAELAGLDPADAAAEVRGLIRPVPGVDGLSVLGGGGRGVLDATGWPVDAVVCDLGAGSPWHSADLVVARPDAGLRGFAGAPVDVPVLMVGDRPLDRADVRRILGGPPAGWLPWSARIARAGCAGRVPSALPGRWLRELRAIVARVRR